LAADAIRFANHRNAWVEVDGGRIVDAGMTGEAAPPVGRGCASIRSVSPSLL
jgi:hypothetical protein